jgi:signal transduction histidine kinase
MIVLVVEDDDADRALLRARIEAAYPGAQVVDVVSQDEWQRALARTDLDVILTDYRLGWTDGVQIVRTIRERLPQVPLIMVTETGSEEIAVEAMKAGLDDYVLKSRLRRLPVAIQAALDRAQYRAQYQNAMDHLAVISHELRGPVNSFAGWLALLRDPGADDAIRVRALGALERAAEAQRAMVDELLDVSRIVTGRIRLDVADVDVVALLRSSLDAVGPEAVSRAIGLEVRGAVREAVVAGDAGRLRQVFDNLVSNALKFTAAGGRVTVDVRVAGEAVRVTVEDTGRGIDPAALSRIFERFSQEPTTGTEPGGGLGLGLAIARRLVELHGGRIEARSAGLGRGAAFAVELPLSQRRPPAPAPGAAADVVAADFTGRRILVVDDDADGAEMVATLLGLHGAEGRTATTPDAALELAERWAPDLLVCDIGLPGTDGYQLLRLLRSRVGAGRLPAIALSGYVRREDRQRAWDAGYEVHLAKPVDRDELVREVQRLLPAGAMRRRP